MAMRSTQQGALWHLSRRLGAFAWISVLASPSSREHCWGLLMSSAPVVAAVPA